MSKLEKKLAALFFDSSKNNKDIITAFEKAELKYSDTTFYLIDK